MVSTTLASTRKLQDISEESDKSSSDLSESLSEDSEAESVQKGRGNQPESRNQYNYYLIKA